MKEIHIGSVSVPLVDYAVGASAVLGIRDSGKTVTSKGIAEQLIDHGIPIIVFDAVGKWRWMKVAGERANGKAYKVVVAGGNAPDLPLTPHSVPEIVRAALKERIPLVIDLFSKTMSKADWRQIVQKAIHIIHYENEGGAVHVFLEEAAEFVPQKIYDGETYAEVEKLVRMGGNASVGITLINQRSQEVNKAVLDNCSTALVLGCQVGKNAIEAVEKWIERLDPKTADAVTESLPKLQSGEAWVWTRKSLTEPTREKMPMCRSLHPDRRTPEIVLKQAKPADTAEFVSRMSSSIPKVIEEAKANDPSELKRTIAGLKKEISVLQQSKPQAAAKSVVKEVPMLTNAERARVTKLTGAFEGLISTVEKLLTIGVKMEELKPDIRSIKSALIPIPALQAAIQSTKPVAMQPRNAPVATRPVPPVSSNGDFKINGAQQRILDALAWYESIGISQPTTLQVGAIALIDATAGHFSNTVGPLSSCGYVLRERGAMALTDEGRKVARVPENIASLDDYHEMLRQRVRRSRSAGGKTVEMLNAIIEQGGASMTTEQIGQAVGIDHTAGHFSNMIGPLSTLGFVERSRGLVTPTEIVFPKGLA